MKNLLLVCIIACLAINVKAQDYKFGKVSKEEVSQKVHPTFPDADASVLYRNVETHFNYTQDDGFTIQTEVHERIKIYNQDGYDQATIEIEQYLGAKDNEEINSLKAYTYNLEGSKLVDTKLQSRNVFEDDKSRFLRVTKFTMPDITDGSVIEYKYTFKSPFISSIDEYRFQEEIPVDKVHMRFLAPEYLVYRTHGKGTTPLNVKNEKRDRRLTYRYESSTTANVADVERGNAELKFVENVTTVDLENIPPLKKEPFSGNLNNYMSALQFELSYTQFPNSGIKNYATTWEDVASKIYESDDFGKQLNQHDYFKKDINDLIASGSSQKEKMMLIYQYVKTKMSWNDYLGVYTDVGVKKAYDAGVGNVADINLMLVSMLKFAGIQSSPILLSTKKNGIPFFPTRSGFNYVIAGASIEGELVLLDGTDKNGMPNILRTELLNWKGRMVKEDGSSRLVDLYPAKSAVHNGMLNLEIMDDMVVRGNVKNRYTGHYARETRTRYGDLDDNEQLKKLDNTFESIDVVDVKFKDLKDPMKPVIIEYNFEAEDSIDEVGNNIYISPLIHLANDKNYFTAEERSHPIDYIYPWSDKYIVTINIPEGYEVVSVPEDLSINMEEGIGSYRYGITQNNGTISIALQNSINTPLINAALYKGLQTYFKMIVEKESEKITLRKI